MVADSEEEEEEEEKEEEEGNVGGFEKLSKWFRGLADLGEPSAPEHSDRVLLVIVIFHGK